MARRNPLLKERQISCLCSSGHMFESLTNIYECYKLSLSLSNYDSASQCKCCDITMHWLSSRCNMVVEVSCNGDAFVQ